MLLALVAVSWGAIPLIVRGDVPWQQLVASRLWLGGLTLLIVLAVRRRLRLPTTQRGRMVTSGALLALHWASFFLAVTRTTVAMALAILYLGPVLASALAPVVLGERVAPQVHAGLALALVGVAAVVRPTGDVDAVGAASAALSAVTLAALMLIAKPAAEALGALVLAAGELVVASLLLAPWAIEAAMQSSAHWRELLLLGVLLTGIADLVYWDAMRVLPVAFVSVLMYLEPASAVVWAMLFLDEVPTVATWLGIGLVLAGGLLAGSVTTRREEAIGVPAAL